MPGNWPRTKIDGHRPTVKEHQRIMKIAIIGSGNVGQALTKSLRKAGHEVVVASEHPEHAREVASQLGVAAEDADAKHKVMDLVSSLGMRPIDAGDLSVARILEGMALLNMKVQIAHGWSWRTAWKLVD